MSYINAHQINQYMYFERDLLGQGSFGRVYKAIDTSTKENVAVKIMDMTLFTDEYMLNNLNNEIDVMIELYHPHIVKLIECINTQDSTILILELCDIDLRGELEARGGMMDEQQATDVLQQVMQGFQLMVRHGYVHRDIKPENILSAKGKYKVGDFGFATKCDIHGRQLMKDCVGTPLYMAPQILEKNPYTSKSDIWSIGVVVYEMLYGRQPWPCRDLNSYITNMKNMPLRFPFEKQISLEMKDFISRCLRVDENDRISWDDIFNHAVIKKKVQDRQFISEKIDTQTKSILASIQHIVQVKNVDIITVFAKFDLDMGGQLDHQEFQKFVMDLDPRITECEAEYLLKVFDTNNDGSVSFEEFKRIFSQYDFRDLSDRAGHIITDLKEIIKANNLNLQDIFSNFDCDKEGNLDFNEFSKLIRVIAPAIRDKEIKQIFKKFDMDNSNGISFDEFNKELRWATDQDLLFDPAEEKAKKVLTELKGLVLDNDVDLNQIFANFDTEKKGYLGVMQIHKLCQVMEPQMQLPQAEVVMKKIDTDQSGKIDFKKFMNIFK